MKPERQLIAIAEECGWQDCEFIWPLQDCRGTPPETFKGDVKVTNNKVWAWLPNYLGDLNEVHKVLTKLSGGSQNQHRIFSDHLEVIVCRTRLGPTESIGWRKLTATAAQLAEAFLRTINKWEET
jgi:hypothetical protein